METEGGKDERREKKRKEEGKNQKKKRVEEEEEAQMMKGKEVCIPNISTSFLCPAMFLIRLDVRFYAISHSLIIIFTPCLMAGTYTRV